MHAGTGIPELTIDQWTNQKILEYHRHVTDMIHGKKNDKWINIKENESRLDMGEKIQVPILS